MRALLLFAFLFFCLALLSTAQAAGPQEFKTLKELEQAGSFRLTCSAMGAESQVHTFVNVEQGKVDQFQLVLVYPALSMKIRAFTPAQAKGMKLALSSSQLEISGSRPGAYLNEEASLVVRDGANGLKGELSYDDFDGFWIQQPMKCGAVNYF